jgi:uncharacterized protein YjbJ (UPF0337 family)
MADIDSRIEQAKGKAKEAVADLTDDDDLRREGKADHAAGTAKGKLDELKHRADDAIDHVKEIIEDR